MFTGLIENVGKIVEVTPVYWGLIFSLECDLNLCDIKIGDSVAINGACQTVIKKTGKILSFEAMSKTIEKTNFAYFKKGDFVNLERAMCLNSRLDGHLVSGHIDCVARLLNIRQEGIAKIFHFECDTNLIVEQGSISVNGVSLTVSALYENSFEVSVLPYTFDNTNLKFLKQNDLVNIEYDMVGKYVKKFTTVEKKSKITKEFLIENGF